MKALVYHGPGKPALEEKPQPVLKAPTDAIVRISRTTICGTDLHIMKGDLPAVTDVRILGHEKERALKVIITNDQGSRLVTAGQT